MPRAVLGYKALQNASRRFLLITIQPKVLNELKGCKAFGFKAKTNYRQKIHSTWRNPEEQREQNQVVSIVVSSLQQLTSYPCGLSVTIGSQNGESIFEGTIEPLDQISREKAEIILDEVRFECFDFSRRFPRSTFSIKYEQSVEVTRVDR